MQLVDGPGLVLSAESREDMFVLVPVVKLPAFASAVMSALIS